MVALASTSPVLCLAWTLLHAVWQSFLVWLVYRLVRASLRDPAIRCNVGHAALLVFIAAQCLTFLHLITASAAIGPLTDVTFERIALADTAARQLPMPHLGLTDRIGAWIARHERYLPIVALLWGVGLFFRVAKTSAEYLFLQRHLNACTEIGDTVGERFAELAKRVRLSRSVRFLESKLVDTPATARWLKPVVLVPAAAILSMEPAHLDALILHELAHIRRWDYATNILRTLAAELYFFLPFVRDICTKTAADAESATDRLASSALGDEKRYADSLVALADFRRTLPDLALSMPSSGSDLRTRILHLLTTRSLPSSTLRTRMSMSGTLLAGSIGLGLLISATIWTSQARAAMTRAATHSFAEVVVQTLSKDVPNDAYEAPLTQAMRELQISKALSDATAIRLADALLEGVDAKVLYRQLADYPGTVDFDTTRNARFGPFGHNGDRAMLLADLRGKAKRAPDAATRSRLARAALVFSSLMTPSDSGGGATSLLRDVEFLSMLRLSNGQYQQLRLAAAVNNERKQKLGPVITAARREIETDADAEAYAAELPYLPAFQTLLCNKLPEQFQRRVAAIIHRDQATYPPGSVDFVLKHLPY